MKFVNTQQILKERQTNCLVMGFVDFCYFISKVVTMKLDQSLMVNDNFITMLLSCIESSVEIVKHIFHKKYEMNFSPLPAIVLKY